MGFNRSRGKGAHVPTLGRTPAALLQLVEEQKGACRRHTRAGDAAPDAALRTSSHPQTHALRGEEGGKKTPARSAPPPLGSSLPTRVPPRGCEASAHALPLVPNFEIPSLNIARRTFFSLPGRLQDFDALQQQGEGGDSRKRILEGSQRFWNMVPLNPWKATSDDC